MASDLIDIIASLALIMNEETERLTARERGLDLAELAAAKIRLTGLLEGEVARLNRTQPGWADAMDEATRAALSDGLIALGAASGANAAVLERHIDLSTELMAAFAAEARRISKSRAETYSATGLLAPIDPASPISINSQY